jgi:hypothetical protein
VYELSLLFPLFDIITTFNYLLLVLQPTSSIFSRGSPNLSGCLRVSLCFSKPHRTIQLCATILADGLTHDRINGQTSTVLSNSRGRGGRGGEFFGRQANGLPWPAPDRRWRDRLTEGQRRDLLDSQAIMRADTGHPGWINERSITSNRRDTELEAIDGAIDGREFV